MPADTLLDNLTVREMLLYTAELKNPSSVPLQAKAARVDAVLSQLALWDCRDVRIGSALARGISGELARMKFWLQIWHPAGASQHMAVTMSR